MENVRFCIVRCSSQDPAHRAENILMKDKSWLSNKMDKVSTIKAEIHLSRAIKIGFINIGNAGSHFVQISVGNSLWPAEKDFLCLVPSTSFMSPEDIKAGKNTKTVRMLDQESFAKDVSQGEWDRVRIVCCQALNKERQFGLQFVDIIEAKAKHAKVGHRNSDDQSSTSTPSLAEFKRKLLAKSVDSSPGSLHQLGLPTSSRATNIVHAALKGKQKTSSLDRNNMTNSNKTKRRIILPPADSSYPKLWKPNAVLDDCTENKVDVGLKAPRHSSPRKGKNSSSSNVDALEECPICANFFPVEMIEVHASTCGSPSRESPMSCSPTRAEVQIYSPVKSAGRSDSSSDEMVSCPVCFGMFPVRRIRVHANVCAEISLAKEVY